MAYKEQEPFQKAIFSMNTFKIYVSTQRTHASEAAKITNVRY